MRTYDRNRLTIDGEERSWVYPYELELGQLAVVQFSPNMMFIGRVVTRNAKMPNVLLDLTAGNAWRARVIEDKETDMRLRVLEPGEKIVVGEN